MQSMLVYLFSCAQCGASYVGSTKLTLASRIDQHVGRSSRTGRPLSSPSFSHIRNHTHNVLGPDISDKHFKVLAHCRDENSLRIMESIFIKTYKPNLNDHQSSSPLFVLG